MGSNGKTKISSLIAIEEQALESGTGIHFQGSIPEKKLILVKKILIPVSENE